MSVTTVQCRHCKTTMAADWRDKHVCPRSGEPPMPWTVAMAKRNGVAAAPKLLRDSDGVPMPWSSALRDRSEVR